MTQLLLAVGSFAIHIQFSTLWDVPKAYTALYGVKRIFLVRRPHAGGLRRLPPRVIDSLWKFSICSCPSALRRFAHLTEDTVNKWGKSPHVVDAISFFFFFALNVLRHASEREREKEREREWELPTQLL